MTSLWCYFAWLSDLKNPTPYYFSCANFEVSRQNDSERCLSRCKCLLKVDCKPFKVWYFSLVKFVNQYCMFVNHDLRWKCSGLCPREGVIIEWPLNCLFHDRRDVILTSPMVVIRFLSNNDRYLKYWNVDISVTQSPKFTRLKRITNQLSFVYTVVKSLYILHVMD